MKYEVIEIYDGRLPEYQVVDEQGNLIKSFDSVEEAETFLNSL